MLSRRSDLAFERGALDRFLPWLVAFMAYVATIALAGMFVLHATAEAWRSGLEGALTVEIRGGAGSAADAQRRAAALDVLGTVPGVATARAIPEEEVRRLLSPWLGNGALGEELPLPLLIEVTAVPGARIDVAALGERLSTAVPGAVIDDHAAWVGRLVRLLRTAEVLAMVVVGLITLVTVGSVAVTTRAGLAIHRNTIEVLHLIGARDTYVARQFAARAFRFALLGGTLGVGLALLSLIALDRLTFGLEGQTAELLALSDWHISPVAWAVLAVVPLLIASVATVAARLTVTRSLARMF